MYTAPKSVRHSTVHQTYVVFFLNILILILGTNIHLKKKDEEKNAAKVSTTKKKKKGGMLLTILSGACL